MEKRELVEKTIKRVREVAREMDERLACFWDDKIEEKYGLSDEQKRVTRRVLEHAKEHCLRSAKRVRAFLVMCGYGVEGKKPDEEVWKAMEAVELIQTALLMHDDFMDQDELRRGKETTQVFFGKKDKHYGESMAVDTGDAVLCLGFERLSECGGEKARVLAALRKMINGIYKTALGQAFDVSLPWEKNTIDEEDVKAIHQSKTALYTFQNPLEMGALLAGVSEKKRELLVEYGLKMGGAFQMKDDVLGMFGEMEKTGKSDSSDLRQGKITLLSVKTLAMGNKNQKESFARAFGNREADEKTVEEAKKVVMDSGALQYAEKKIEMEIEKALEAVCELEKEGGDVEVCELLRGVAYFVAERES